YWGYLVEAGLSEFALYIEVFGEAETAVGLKTHVGGFPAGFGAEELGHIGLGAAGLALVEELGGAPTHEVGSADVHIGPGDGELHALVLADGPAEDLSLFGVGSGCLDEPVAVADALGCDEDPLGIHAVQDV